MMVSSSENELGDQHYSRLIFIGLSITEAIENMWLITTSAQPDRVSIQGCRRISSVVVYRLHSLNGGSSNLPSICTKRWSYMKHKLMKTEVEIAYILPLGPYTIIYPTTKTRYMNHSDRLKRVLSTMYYNVSCFIIITHIS